MHFKYPEHTWIFLLLLIPVLIHLLRFRKQKKLLFPGVFRLVSLLKETQSTHQLKQYIVLLNRVLIIGVISLLFTEPSCKPKGAPAKNQLGVIWDSSPSMWEPDASGKIPAERMKSTALSWLKQLPENTEIIWLDRPYQEQVAFTKNQAIERLKSTTEPIHPMPITELMALNRLPPYSGTWYVLSDLDSDVKKALNELGSQQYALKIINFDIQRGANASLDTAYCEQILEERYQVKISRNAIKNPLTLKMSVHVDGVYVGDERVNFEPQEISKWVPVTLSASSGKTIKFTIESDAYLADNTLFLHPIQTRKTRLYVPESPRFPEIERIVKTFEDRIERVNTFSDADVLLWVTSQRKHPELPEIFEEVKKGKQLVVIPENTLSGMPWGLISGGSWERLKSENGAEIDYRGFKQWPFQESLIKDVELGKTTMLPKLYTHFKVSLGDQNRDWQRYLITENDADFLLKKDLGDGKIWLFATDFKEGFSEIKKSTWFVGILAPLMLASNNQIDPVCGFFHHDWIPIPANTKLKNSDRITLTKSGKSWSSNLGMYGGYMCFNGVKDETMQAGWYQITGVDHQDSVILALNTRRLEQHSSIPLQEEGIEDLKTLSVSQWMGLEQGSSKTLYQNSMLKFLLVVLLITELLLGIFLLRTNR